MNNGLLVGLAVPAGLIAILAMARLARVRPVFRPLVGPFALATCAVLGLLVFGGGRFPESGWLSLVFLVPFLILLVRGTVIAFQALFRRRQGATPPALLDSVVSVMAYAIGLGAIAHQWFGLELTPFLATSAVVGAVVGLALQDTLGNPSRGSPCTPRPRSAWATGCAWGTGTAASTRSPGGPCVCRRGTATRSPSPTTRSRGTPS
jgi:small-conductance mechanosensitive channel